MYENPHFSTSFTHLNFYFSPLLVSLQFIRLFAAKNIPAQEKGLDKCWEKTHERLFEAKTAAGEIEAYLTVCEMGEQFKDLILPEDRSLSAFLPTREYKNRQFCIPARSKPERPGGFSASNPEE